MNRTGGKRERCHDSSCKEYATETESGIRNDPNDWCREHGNPTYILDLLKRVIRVSVETDRIVRTLPGIA